MGHGTRIPLHPRTIFTQIHAEMVSFVVSVRTKSSESSPKGFLNNFCRFLEGFVQNLVQEYNPSFSGARLKSTNRCADENFTRKLCVQKACETVKKTVRGSRTPIFTALGVKTQGELLRFQELTLRFPSAVKIGLDDSV